MTSRTLWRHVHYEVTSGLLYKYELFATTWVTVPRPSWTQVEVKVRSGRGRVKVGSRSDQGRVEVWSSQGCVEVGSRSSRGLVEVGSRSIFDLWLWSNLWPLTSDRGQTFDLWPQSIFDLWPRVQNFDLWPWSNFWPLTLGKPLTARSKVW